jgi:hypothetical protein
MHFSPGFRRNAEAAMFRFDALPAVASDEHHRAPIARPTEHLQKTLYGVEIDIDQKPLQ